MNTQLKSKQKLTFKQMLLASFLVASLPATTLAHAEHQGDNKEQRCERGGMVQHGLQQSMRDLDLTSAQQDQLFNLNYAQIPAMRDQHKQQQQLRLELRAAAQAEKFDDGKAQLLADRAAKLEKEKVLARVRQEAKMFALLTPAQRVKAREFKFDGHDFNHGDQHHEGEYDNDNNHRTRFKQSHRSIEQRAM